MVRARVITPGGIGRLRMQHYQVFKRRKSSLCQQRRANNETCLHHQASHSPLAFSFNTILVHSSRSSFSNPSVPLSNPLEVS